MAVISGSFLYTIVGIAIAYLCKAIALKVLGVAIVVYGIFQFIYVLSHKQMSEKATRFFVIMNIVPYFLYSIGSW
jgi:uncharacterized membrane protein HdeD (DUF308 family)